MTRQGPHPRSVILLLCLGCLWGACSNAKVPSKVSVASGHKGTNGQPLEDSGSSEPSVEDDGGGHQPDPTGGMDASTTPRSTLPADGSFSINSDRCAFDHNNCDPATTCSYDAGIAMCGPCPAGYVGTGSSGCKPSAQATAVARGGGHACVLLTTGVKCWGDNAHGQLGLGDNENRGDRPAEMGNALPVLDLGAGQTAVMLALGEAHSCAVLDHGKVKCWGDNAHGQLGLGDTNSRGDDAGEMGDALPALDLGGGRNPIMLALGETHTCALFDDGGVKCWGDNADGQLGLGDTQARGGRPNEMGDQLPLVDLGKARGATAIAAGGGFTCALLDGGEIKCWGHNADGQLGLGDTQTRGDLPNQMGDHLPAIDLGVGRTAAALTAGGSHACAWLDGGVIKCWGRNQDGQLGLGDADNRGDGPDEMGDHLPTIDLAEGVLAVAAGLGHTCALLDGGAIKCWGVNADGQLGLGDARTRGALPNQMAVHLPTVDLGEHRDQTEPRSVIGIALGFAQSCGLLSNGAVKCWGSGEAGALGSGDVDARGDGPNEMADALAPIDFGD